MKEKRSSGRLFSSKILQEREPREQILMRGRTGVTVYGCRKILRYCPEEILLRCAKEGISIQGEGLYCRTFSAGVVEVDGRINGVNFLAKEAISAEFDPPKRRGGAR
ncbi:MAG: YabP/YqfC family sporulation protein [Clostridia bacterium]|nr:YabP/YqfC family sporulation protein [Clostridia bacterium]